MFFKEGLEEFLNAAQGRTRSQQPPLEDLPPGVAGLGPGSGLLVLDVFQHAFELSPGVETRPQGMDLAGADFFFALGSFCPGLEPEVAEIAQLDNVAASLLDPMAVFVTP